MRSFKDFSINTKLNLLVLLSSGVALLLSCGALAVNDYGTIRDSKVRQLSALAEVLGFNSTAALTFDDPSTAAEILASLWMQPTVEFACLYDPQGKVFATYGREPVADFTPPPNTDGYRFTERGYLDVTRRIVQDQELIGVIYLHATMRDLRKQLLQYATIVAIVLGVSLSGAILLSARLQRAISLPILRLADTVQEISSAGDYSIRVSKEADDELGALYDEFNRMLDQIQRGKKELQTTHDQLEMRVEQRTRQLSETNLELNREIAERRRAEKELEEAHQRLVETARRAGMAEIATGVLHNVGNVLNSVNVSAALVSDRLQSSKLSDLVRATEMIDQHADELDSFFTQDEKGKLLPDFLSMLAEHLNQERAAVLEELHDLANNLGHVKAIVAMQQSYAGVVGMVEAVSLADLLDDALKLNFSSFEKYDIEVLRRYVELPEVRVEKQKLLQILINLIANAKDSLIESTNRPRQMFLHIVRCGEDRLRIDVSDNGVGIPKDNLTRIFSHGFTTKRHGHGFGLHASANAAKEIGGRLRAQSDGPDRGATFRIEFPFEPVEVPVESAANAEGHGENADV